MLGRWLAKPRCIGFRTLFWLRSGIGCFLTGLVGRNSANHRPRVGLRTTAAVIAWPVLGQSRQLSAAPPASPEGHKQPPRRLGPAGGDQIVGGGDDGQQLVEPRLGVPQTPASTTSLLSSKLVQYLQQAPEGHLADAGDPADLALGPRRGAVLRRLVDDDAGDARWLLALP